MNLGKRIRLNRIFSHPSGRLCSVAVDHFIGYGRLLGGGGLSNLPLALERVVSGAPGAVTMQKGTAMTALLTAIHVQTNLIVFHGYNIVGSSCSTRAFICGVGIVDQWGLMIGITRP